MIVLAFDTSGPYCAASILRDDKVITAYHEDMARGQVERLMPLLEQLLSEARVDWSDLNALGVGIGPGNFTGIRISVSAGRGLAMGLDVPAVGVSLLETTRALSGAEGVAVPAPRGQVYFLDTGKMDVPILADPATLGSVAVSTDFSARDHTTAMARIAAERVNTEATTTPPVPLYVRPADAAPMREAPPVMLDDA